MKGHTLWGMFGGFFAGLFLGITLWIYAVIPFASNLMWILPLVGIVFGLMLAAWAPFGSGSAAGTPAATGGIAYDAAGDADPYSTTHQTTGTTIEQEAVPPPGPLADDVGADDVGADDVGAEDEPLA